MFYCGQVEMHGQSSRSAVFCARIYGALRRSSTGLSPAFTQPFCFFRCLTYTYKQEQGNKSRSIQIVHLQVNY